MSSSSGPSGTTGGGSGVIASADVEPGGPLVTIGGGGPSGSGGSTVGPKVEPGTPPTTETALTLRTDAKALSNNVETGLKWLASHQLKSGGWGQGDESVHMGHQMDQMAGTANVADTSMALLALLRSGSTARTGDYSENIQRGVNYILAEIEASDSDSLYVTSVRGTRIQGKIGTYADTFAALMVLTEAKGKMSDGIANTRVEKAIAKVVNKIERNQQTDGTFAQQGWAPALTQALAAKSLTRTVQIGMDVKDETLERIEKQAHTNFDARSGAFSAAEGAGVDLYGTAAAASGAGDSAANASAKAAKVERDYKAANLNEAPNAPTKADVDRAQKRAQSSEAAAAPVRAAMNAKLDDAGFISGFGNNGGEEFLSYMLISETMLAAGGAEWAKWDKDITKLVNGVQNADGSWSGHHCITGRTFCTAAALLVLMGDRAPAPTQLAQK